MRWSILVLLAAAPFAAAQPRPYYPPAKKVEIKPEAAPAGSLTPVGQFKAALNDLVNNVGRKTDPEDVRYLSLYALADLKPAEQERYRTLLSVAVNMASTGPAIVQPAIVPETGGLLLRIRLSHYRWNRTAFSVVARRCPFMAEPLLPHREVEYARRLIGVAQDPETFASELVVSGTFLLRDLMQTEQRSETYYDLLYGDRRFGKGSKPKAPILRPPLGDAGPKPVKPAGVSWPGGLWPPGSNKATGTYYPAGEFTWIPIADQERYDRELAEWEARKKPVVGPINPTESPLKSPLKSPPTSSTKNDGNFPQTLDDWEEFWGIKAANDFVSSRDFFVRRGEVVAGLFNDPKRGSIVSYNDRAFVFEPNGSGGVSARTFDNFSTKGFQDYLENPSAVADKALKFDAAETINQLPNGLAAYGLWNGQKARVETGDIRAVRNSQDPHNAAVMTSYTCWQCHAVESGWITPGNRQFRELLEAGAKFNVKREEDDVKARAFFLGWEKLLDAWRIPFALAIEQATATENNPSGWTGRDLASAATAYRDWYDAPVTLVQAAREVGLSPLEAHFVFQQSPTARLNLLAIGKPIPRSAWDFGVARDAVLLTDASREDLDQLTRVALGALLADLLKRTRKDSNENRIPDPGPALRGSAIGPKRPRRLLPVPTGHKRLRRTVLHAVPDVSRPGLPASRLLQRRHCAA